jgi:hypothetical protein
MKTFRFALIGLLLCSTFSFSQVSVNVSIGIPAWGVPVTTERYYYLPDIETYYDIPARQYIYLDRGLWVRRTACPVIYRHYDWYRGRKVVLHDYRGNAPYAFYNVHRVKYVPAFHGNGWYHGRGHLRHARRW